LRDARVLVTSAKLVNCRLTLFTSFDLLDCAVSTTAGQPVGKVVGVQKYGAAPLLAVKSDEGKEVLDSRSPTASALRWMSHRSGS
jgi:ribosomal 30S subunit maturation factor RimM